MGDDKKRIWGDVGEKNIQTLATRLQTGLAVEWNPKSGDNDRANLGPRQGPLRYGSSRYHAMQTGTPEQAVGLRSTDLKSIDSFLEHWRAAAWSAGEAFSKKLGVRG